MSKPMRASRAARMDLAHLRLTPAPTFPTILRSVALSARDPALFPARSLTSVVPSRTCGDRVRAEKGGEYALISELVCQGIACGRGDLTRLSLSWPNSRPSSTLSSLSLYLIPMPEPLEMSHLYPPTSFALSPRTGDPLSQPTGVVLLRVGRAAGWLPAGPAGSVARHDTVCVVCAYVRPPLIITSASTRMQKARALQRMNVCKPTRVHARTHARFPAKTALQRTAPRSICACAHRLNTK